MKKIITLLLTLIMAVSLGSCKNSKKNKIATANELRNYLDSIELKEDYNIEVTYKSIDRNVNSKEGNTIKGIVKGYANVTSKKEFVKRLRCYDAAQIDYIIDDNFFFLSTIHYNCVYIRDIGISSNNPKKVFGVFKEMIEKYTRINKPVYMESREKTSYKLIKFYEKRKYFIITEDELIKLGGEVFHRLKLVAPAK